MYNWRFHIRHTLLLFLYIGSSVTYAQSPTTIPTKKHLRQQKRLEKKNQKEQLTSLTLANARSGHKDTKLTRKQNRKEQRIARKQQKEQLVFKSDSIKIAAMLQLRHSTEAEEKDSLKKVMKDAKHLAKEAILEQEQVKEVTTQVDPYLEQYKKYKSKLALLDSANLPDYASQAGRDALLNDAKQLGLKELGKKEEFKYVKKELSLYLNSPYLKGVKLQYLDSMSLDSLKALSVSTFQKLEKRLEQEIMKRDEFKEFNTNVAEFEALKGLPESYKKQFEKYKNGEGLQKEAMAEAAKKAQALLTKHSKEIQSAQTQLAKLKKKYSSVQSSNDLSTAMKRNSLEGKPIKERIVLGINFQIVSLDPVIIDFNPVLGYKINKKFHVAVGGSYRARFTESHANSPAQGGQAVRIGQDELTYGYRAFAEYKVWKMLGIHAEYERMSKEFEIGTSDTFERKWVEGALAGISSNYTVKGMVKGNFSVLYNFLYSFEQEVYTSPWVFRFGVGL